MAKVTVTIAAIQHYTVDVDVDDEFPEWDSAYWEAFEQLPEVQNLNIVSYEIHDEDGDQVYYLWDP